MGSKLQSGEITKRMNAGAYIAIAVVVCAIVVGGAVMLGKSDAGVINVSGTIHNSNETNAEGQADIETVPEAFKNMPNGGLVPSESPAASDEVVPAEPVPVDGEGDTTQNSETNVPAETVQAEPSTE